MLRTAVLTPPAVRIPVTSTPFCLKNYFSNSDIRRALKKIAPMRDGDGLVHLADLTVAGMGLPGQLLLSGSAIGSWLRSTQTEDTRCVSELPSLP